MPAFDFIECASKAYRYVWDNRQALARLSALVIGIKIVSFALVIMLGLSDHLLRQGLFLLPSYFLEGWAVALIMAQALKMETDKAYVLVRPLKDYEEKNAVMASMILYVLFKIILSVFAGLVFSGPIRDMPEATQVSAPEPGLAMFIASSLFVVFMIWIFRFFWLYVPVALGFSVKHFFKKIMPFSASFYMLGLWAMCFIPPGLVLLVVSGFVDGVLPAAPEAQNIAHGPHAYASAIMYAVFDYATVLIASVGMAYGVSSMFNDENKTVSIL